MTSILSKVDLKRVTDVVELAKRVHPTITNCDVGLVRYAGLLSSTEMFISLNDGSGTHPFSDAIAAPVVKSGQLLAGWGNVRLVTRATGPDSEISSLSGEVRPVPGTTQTSFNPTLIAAAVDSPSLTSSFEALVRGRYDVITTTKSAFGLAAIANDANMNIKFHECDATFAYGSSSKSYTDSLIHIEGICYSGLGVANGTYSSMTAAMKDFLISSSGGSINDRDLIMAAGVYVLQTNSFDFNMNMPYIKGTSRVCVVLPTGNGASGTFKVAAIGVYLLGEGKEGAYAALDFCQNGAVDGTANPAWNSFAGWANASQGASAYTNRVLPSVDVIDYYPLSSNGFLMKEVIGTSVPAVTENMLIANVSVNVHVYAQTISAVVGLLNLADLSNMLSDGLGVWTPQTAAIVAKNVATWQSTTAIAYRWEPTALGPFSLKLTDTYLAYGKQRSRACLTNNYLDLAYDQSVSMKTVENKLQALSGWNVFAQDADSLGSVVTGSDAVTTAVSVTTLTDIGNGNFTYSSNAGPAGTCNTSVASIDAMLTAVMPCTFAGAVAALQAALGDNLGSNLSDLSGSLSVDLNKLAIDMRAQVIPAVLSWNSLRATLPPSKLIWYMASQVAVYSAFNREIPPLLRKYTGATISDVFVNQATSYYQSIGL